MGRGARVGFCLATLAGCTPEQRTAVVPTTQPIVPATRPLLPLANPSFPISIDAARVRLDAMARRPRVRLARPLVICGGFMDVGFGPWLMRRTLEKYVNGPILCVHFATVGSLIEARHRLVNRVDNELGAAADVDVIGQSFGGLIAMHAALPDVAMGPRIHPHRLFTICSPLRGAKMAEMTSVDLLGYQADLRPGSAIGQRLAAERLDYELISYARTNDRKVGEQYEGLPGHPLWWVDTPAGEDAHDGADFDPRILLDLILRLRGETPVTTDPPAPLPSR